MELLPEEQLQEQPNTQPLDIVQPEVDAAQAIADTEAMKTQLQTQNISALPEERQVGLSTFLAKQIAKRKALAEEGTKAMERREAVVIEEEVSDKALSLVEAELTDFDTDEAHQFNFETIKDTDDVAAEFAKMNEANKNAINSQRRNIVPDEELNDVANTLSSDPATIKKVLGLKPGEILAPEYILSMKQTLKQSVKRLKALSEQVVSGEATDADKVAFHKQWEFHSQFTAQFMGVRAEYGRGFRALGLNPFEDGGNASMLNEITDRMSAGMDAQTMAQQILMANDGRAITNVIKNQKGLIGKTGDVFSELFISSILSGVQTHIVNTTSNAFKTISMPLDTVVASMFKTDGTDVIGSGEGIAQLKGMFEANLEALNTAFRVLRTGEAYGGVDKLDVDYQRAISSNALGIPDGKFASTVDGFGKFIRLSTDNLMGAEDAFFKVLNERGKLRQLAHRSATEQQLEGAEYNAEIARFMENPTRTAQEEATQAGLESTFQKRLGGAGQGIQKAREKVWGGKLIMPFVKTPINLLYEGFTERTPLGLISKKFQEDIQAGGSKAQMAKAKMAIGTAVNSTMLGLFYSMEHESDSGVEVYGSYPSDAKLRNSMKEAGIKENSIAVTDEDGKKRYVSFDRLEPFNTVFKLYANIMQVQKIGNFDPLNPDAEKEFSKIAGGITLAFAEATVNQTFMRGVKNIMDALTAGTNVKRIESIASQYANALAIPHSSATRNITRLFDEQMRDADGILNKLMKTLPVISKDHPPVLDNYGKPVKYENNFFPSFYKPGQKGSDDKVRNEIHRITQATRTVPVYKPKKNFGGYRMTPEQYHYYTDSATNDKIKGLNLYDDLKKTINSTSYKKSNNHVKAIYLNAIRDKHYDYAKYKKLFVRFPEIQQYDLDKMQYKNKFLIGE